METFNKHNPSFGPPGDLGALGTRHVLGERASLKRNTQTWRKSGEEERKPAETQIARVERENCVD